MIALMRQHLQFTFLACVAWLASVAAAKPILVVATTSIIGDWVHNVGGDDVSVVTLVGPDGDPHEYQPAADDSVKLAEAVVIFENGLGLEPWLDKLCESAQAKAARSVVSAGIAVRHASNAQDRDPHVWQNVADGILCVCTIRDELVKVDASNAAGYTARAAAYVAKLKALDGFIGDQIKSIPAARRKLITSHDAFGYFGQRYGIEVSRSALESVTTEAADPSAQQLADVIDQVKASGVPVIFLENIQNPRLIEQIANDADVKVGPPLYSDALGQAGSAGDTYLKMMRYNAKTLTDALK